jgi:hypothetical protein
LPDERVRVLADVLISWLEQRLKNKTKEEIEAMIVDLPPLEETRSGQDLIRIGQERGLREAILLVLRRQQGSVPPEMEEKLRTLSAEDARRLLEYLLETEGSRDVDRWLETNSSK